MGIFLFPSPTTVLSTRQLRAQHVNSCYFRQQGTDVREFACDFLIEVDHLEYSDADIKEVFNICLNQPLSLWEMEELRNLGFWDFVYHVYHCGEPEPPPQAKSHSSDCPPFPPEVSGSPRKNGPERRPKRWPMILQLRSQWLPVMLLQCPQRQPKRLQCPHRWLMKMHCSALPEVTQDAAAPPEVAQDAAAPSEAAKDAAAPPEAADYAMEAPPEAVMPLPRSQRRRRERKASSVPHGLEAIQEITASPETVPEPSLLPCQLCPSSLPCKRLPSSLPCSSSSSLPCQLRPSSLPCKRLPSSLPCSSSSSLPCRLQPCFLSCCS